MSWLSIIWKLFLTDLTVSSLIFVGIFTLYLLISMSFIKENIKENIKESIRIAFLFFVAFFFAIPLIGGISVLSEYLIKLIW